MAEESTFKTEGFTEEELYSFTFDANQEFRALFEEARRIVGFG